MIDPVKPSIAIDPEKSYVIIKCFLIDIYFPTAMFTCLPNIIIFFP